jgi:IS5 family transposase
MEEPMLQIRAKEPELFDYFLPENLKKLPEELQRINELLDNPAIVEPFVKRFNVLMGRPTVPIETYVRLMYLKFRHQLGYETLVAEVADSYTWRKFCGIGLNDRVPDSTTLIKLTHKYGEETIKELHNALIAGLKTKKLIRGRKIRMDTTVVEANVHYPTDASVLTDGIRRMYKQVSRIEGSGLQLGRSYKKVKKLLFSISQHLRKRNNTSQDKVRKINKKIIGIANAVISKVRAVINNKTVINKHTKNVINSTASITEQVATQSLERMDGIKPQGRIVSIHDPEARPIVRGKIDKPVQFGRMTAIVQDESGYITVAQTHQGNPAEVNMTQQLVNEHQDVCSCKVNAVAADTGFSSDENIQALESSGIKHVGIPVRGRPMPEIRRKQKQIWFKKLRAFRAGIEGVISFLKRSFGLGRSLLRGNAGTSLWVSWAVIAANLYRFGKNL